MWLFTETFLQAKIATASFIESLDFVQSPRLLLGCYDIMVKFESVLSQNNTNKESYDMKTLFIIAGANGSGKTTFAKSFSTLHGLYFINADEIAKELDSENITRYKIKAGKIFFERFDKRLLLDRSFVIETTLSGKYLIKYIQKAKKLNFVINIIYLYLENPAANILRVKNRVLNGGHHIPSQDITRRYHRSKHMFQSTYKYLADMWDIYHNSDDVFETIANNHTIYDHEKYKNFLKDTR